MNQKQAAALADMTTLIAKMSADPVIVRYNKLRAFAELVDLRLNPEGEKFTIRDKRGQILFECDSTEGLNEWFKGHYMEDAL